MKKSFMFLFLCLTMCLAQVQTFAYCTTQDAGTTVLRDDQPAAPVVDQPAAPEKTGFFKGILKTVGFDGSTAINIILGLFALAFSGLWVTVKTKLRQAGGLLIEAADAIEDKNVNANEKKQLAKDARALISKT